MSVDDVVVSTDVLTVAFTPLGGAIRSVTLNGYPNFDRTGPLVLLTDFDKGVFPTEITSLAGEDVGGVPYALESVETPEGAADRKVSFAAVLPTGWKITKTYRLPAAKYGIFLEVTVENLAPAARRAAYDINGPAGLPSEDYSSNDVVGVLVTFKDAPGPDARIEFKTAPAAKLAGKGPIAASPGVRTSFAGATNRYFASVLRPDLSVPLLGASAVPVGMTSAGARFTVGDLDLAAAGAQGARATQVFILYCGPKDQQELAAFNTPEGATGFGALLDYGWFEPLVKVVLWLLKVFHKAIPNWGVAIILLTLLIRAVMHPLTRKSQVAMAKMQKIQPHIKKLQEKHKGDKQKLGQEQMKLMKEHGANPMGGCLPLLIQLPIFFALYRALSVSLDLRHAPFVLWINNLSQPDHLLFLGMKLPLIGTWLNLLPILMALSMVLQQRMSPKAATPEAEQQQKIMGIFMPIFMGVILYNFAAGLNLYILTSTLAGSLESWIIRRHLAAQD